MSKKRFGVALAVYGVLTAVYYAGSLVLEKRRNDKYIELVRNNV